MSSTSTGVEPEAGEEVEAQLGSEDEAEASENEDMVLGWKRGGGNGIGMEEVCTWV